MIGAEQWRAVVGHEGSYEVSDRGRVRTKERRLIKGCCDFVRKPLLLAMTWGGRTNTYRRVMLMNPKRHAYVHHLVAEAFIGPRPDGMVVAHGDDIGHHNWLGNISYKTQDENITERDANRTPVAAPAGIGSADDVPW